MSAPEITVITPTYNRAHTLQRVYESLKTQTFMNFIWYIMDDGSTDNTAELVENWQKESPNFEISYMRISNVKKFVATFKAIETVTTPFFTVLDSDDAYLPQGLEILYENSRLIDPDKFISVTAHSVTPEGQLVGTLFPENFDSSILKMRYRHKVKGDKHSIFLTDKYKKYLQNFNYRIYSGKYMPQRVFFTVYDAAGEKSRYINKAVRIYFADTQDNASMTRQRISPSAYEGNRLTHLAFVNEYGYKLLFYPAALLRNMGGYLLFSILCQFSFKKAVLQLKNPVFKIMAVLLYLPVLIYRYFAKS